MTAVSAEQTPATRAPRPSTFSLKIVMAVTGTIFVLFVFVHMIGNLKVYGGADSLDSYARWLREVGHPLVPRHGVLWALRVVLLVALGGHLMAAAILWARGRRARGRFPRRSLTGFTAWAARTMVGGGLIILGFVVVHVLDLTLGVGPAATGYLPPDPDGTVHAHANLVASFSRPWMATFYALSMVVLAAHVLHGWHCLLQDLGGTGRRLRAVWSALGVAIAVSVLLGNALIPVLVLLGVLS